MKAKTRQTWTSYFAGVFMFHLGLITQPLAHGRYNEIVVPAIGGLVCLVLLLFFWLAP